MKLFSNKADTESKELVEQRTKRRLAEEASLTEQVALLGTHKLLREWDYASADYTYCLYKWVIYFEGIGSGIPAIPEKVGEGDKDWAQKQADHFKLPMPEVNND